MALTCFFPQEDVLPEVREESLKLHTKHAECCCEPNTFPDGWFFTTDGGVQRHGTESLLPETSGTTVLAVRR